MALPELSGEQRASAREKAAASRRARRELLTQISTGHLSLASVLARAGTDPIIAQTRVSLLLRAVPGSGASTVARALVQAGINDRRRVQGLSPWQHDALLNALRFTALP